MQVNYLQEKAAPAAATGLPIVMKYNAGNQRKRRPPCPAFDSLHFAGSVGRLCSMLIKNSTSRHIYKKSSRK
ncbi:hypothetical protein D3C72_1201910 [compost metagenome]